MNEIIKSQQTDIELCKPDFISKDFQLPYYLKRIPGQDSRWYFDIKEGIVKYYMGVTSMLQRYTPTPNPIIRWMCKFSSYEEAMIKLNKESIEGTFLHRIYGIIVRENKFSLNDNFILDELRAFAEYEGFSLETYDKEEINKWLYRIKQDVIGFFYWKKEYNIRPLGIEFTLKSEKLKLAGTMDLICKASMPNKEKVMEDVTILVDFKKGRKSFYDDQILQQILYRPLIKENFPELGDIRCFLYGCKNYRLPIGKSVTPYRFKEIDYNLKYKIVPYVKLYLEEREKEILEPKFRTQFKDMTLDENTDLNNVFIEFDIQKYIKELEEK